MPHVSTTVFGGTPKIFQPFGSLPASPASATTLLWSSASFLVTGPARCFFWSSKRYQDSVVFSSASACWPASSA